MKHKYLSVLSTLLTLTLVSCGNTNTSVSSNPVETNEDTPFEQKKLADFVDYSKDLKFDQKSKRKFVEVSIKSLIDGDTSHFNVPTSSRNGFPSSLTTNDDGILKIRYLGIDTPESTGAVEEWGKTASAFNKSKLHDATSVIVESNDENWNVDSTGTRVLAFVWYKTATMTDYVNLNLEIMQEGLAYAKNLNSLCYQEAFQKAYSQALDHELCVFSKAASKWQFDSATNAIVDINGYAVGAKKSKNNVISFAKNELADINTVGLYTEKGKRATSGVITNNLDDNPAYTLGVEIDGTLNYLTGNIYDGVASLTTDVASARKYYVEKDASKAGCYNIYYLDSSEVKNFFTINSSNNIDYMQRDANFYYGAYLEATIKGLRTNPTDYEGKLVRFEGVVAYSNDKTYYLQAFDQETELYYGIQVYVGFNFSSGEALLKNGNLVSICGTYSYYETGGTYQVSGLTYMVMKPNYEKNTRLISENNEINIKKIQASDLLKTKVDASDLYDGISYTETLMNTMVSLDNLTVTDVYTTKESSSSAGAMTLTCKDANNNVITVRTEVIYKEDKTLATASDFMGKSINVTKGMVDYYSGSYQVRVFTYNDFTFNN